MAQQQLLLLILAIVLVGVGIVTGLSAYSEGKQQSDFAHLTEKAIELAVEVIAWKRTPTAMHGGSGYEGLGGLTASGLGYNSNGHENCDFVELESMSGENCFITPLGEFHIARDGGPNNVPGAIGYIHAIGRHRRTTVRVFIIHDPLTDELVWTLDDPYQAHRDALPFR